MAFPELIYKSGLITIFTILTVMRTVFKVRAHVYRKGFFSPEEGYLTIGSRFILGIPLLGSFSLYIIDHTMFTWMYLPLPDFLRFTGILISLAALYLLLQSHKALGKYFSTTLRFADHHHLITTGPYRYIQHPIYLAYFILFLSAFIVTNNWVIGITGTGIISMLMTLRRRREENLLLEHFGDTYRDYQASTGRFFPRRRKSEKCY